MKFENCNLVINSNHVSCCGIKTAGKGTYVGIVSRALLTSSVYVLRICFQKGDHIPLNIGIFIATEYGEAVCSSSVSVSVGVFSSPPLNRKDPHVLTGIRRYDGRSNIVELQFKIVHLNSHHRRTRFKISCKGEYINTNTRERVVVNLVDTPPVILASTRKAADRPRASFNEPIEEDPMSFSSVFEKSDDTFEKNNTQKNYTFTNVELLSDGRPMSTRRLIQSQSHCTNNLRILRDLDSPAGEEVIVIGNPKNDGDSIVDVPVKVRTEIKISELLN